MSHTIEEESAPKEVSVLMEIREAEKKSDEILEKARLQKDSIIQSARADAAKLISSRQDEIRASHEKKIVDFREKSKFIIEEKIAEGKASARQVSAKSGKNSNKAVVFILKKFEEMI
jgi:vacuolar-type H+-ATPase subunit H